MTFDLGYLFLVGLVYLSTLFFIAYAAERGWFPVRVVRHPITYALSLGVYTTSWSYYGSVGFAQEHGFLFLAVYLGPTLAYILTPVLLAPILRLVREYQLTSLADLLAFRYGSQLAGVLVTLFMLTGSLPYIALQIRAVSESLGVLTQDTPPLEFGLIFCLTLTVFAILFGARQISPREKHAGLVLAIAFESLVKLVALIAVGFFAVFGVFGDVQGLDDWLRENPQAVESLYAPLQEQPWFTLILLSFAAAFLLPRQFHMAFVENLGTNSLSLASWAFPLYLLIFNLPIPLILWAGEMLSPNTDPEYYLLGITLFADTPLLPTIAFIGGLSAASAMVIVTTLALAAMALNHLLLPARYPDPVVNLYRGLLWGRRVIIALIILTAYGLYVVLERNQGLVELGLISFVAVAQFVPGIVGVLLWPGATRSGFLVGLAAGVLVWIVSLLLPMLERSGVLTIYYDPVALLGAPGGPPWAAATFWSLSVNSLLFVAVSLVTRHGPGEKAAIAACFRDNLLTPSGRAVRATSPKEFSDQLARIIGAPAGEREVRRAVAELQLTAHETRPWELQRLRDQLERNLSGMLGPVLARKIVESRLQVTENSHNLVADHIRTVDERLENSQVRLRGLARELNTLRIYHRQILQDLPLGACSLSAEGEILHWNQAMTKLSGVDQHQAVGLRTTDLAPPWGALLGDFLDTDAQHAHKQWVAIGGRPRWFNLHKAAIDAPPKSARADAPWGGVVTLVEDLTEVQTLEAELIHSERLASIGRLAAGVAHEIGNPITGIACLAQNLRDETDPALAAESATEILEQTRRVAEIVQSLISFSHRGPPAGPSIRTFDVRKCVDEALRLVQLSHKGKQLRYTNHCESALVVTGDRQRLLQVFVNLLTNACDASPPRGYVEVRCQTSNKEVLIDVVDNGEGIPAANRERIFEPFFTTKEPGTGTGLGLPLAYSIVADHGGTISIDSELGSGTRVTIRLPLHGDR